MNNTRLWIFNDYHIIAKSPNCRKKISVSLLNYGPNSKEFQNALSDNDCSLFCSESAKGSATPMICSNKNDESNSHLFMIIGVCIGVFAIVVAIGFFVWKFLRSPQMDKNIYELFNAEKPEKPEKPEMPETKI